MSKIFLVALIFLVSCFTQITFAENQVTTYITVTQEQRRSSQFNMTEWLRIRERMKEMDVYLAMMSDPKKEKFHLEISGVYTKQKGIEQGTFLLANGQTRIERDAAKVQLWLSNLVNQTFGVRTLNVDLGFEYANFPVTASTSGSINRIDAPVSQYTTVNLRIFGKNIQDSSFVLKAGKYIDRDTVTNSIVLREKNRFVGNAAGLEMQLYILPWFGFEGNYMSFMNSEDQHIKYSTTQSDYGLFLEVSLFRFMGGFFNRDRDYIFDNGPGSMVEKGTYIGLKLQL